MSVKQTYINISRRKVTRFSSAISQWGESNLRNFPWRKKSASNYQKIMTEVLLQRTKAQTVNNIYESFFSTFPSWKALSRARKSRIEKVLMPIGLYKRRANSIKELAVVLAKSNGRFPRTREEIDKLPGVGQYIGNAVELFVFSRPLALLDVNMARLVERYFGPRKLADIRYDPYLQNLSSKIIRSADDPAWLNWVILDFGSMVCTAKSPKCDKCPVSKSCNYLKLVRAKQDV